MEKKRKPDTRHYGFVYIIHLVRPMHHMRHYCGWCFENLEHRMAQHECGRGAKCLKAANEKGIGWILACYYPAGKTLESYIKRMKNTKTWCPICQKNHSVKNKRYDTRQP